MQTHRAVVLTLVLVGTGISACVPRNDLWSESSGKDTSEQLTFVRQFSSSRDVQRELYHVLNRGLDIIAGPGEPAVGALQEPYSVTTDSTHRIFITDIKAATVHVFDPVHSQYSVLRGGHPLRSPVGIATDREGNVYVSDSSLQEILVYDSKGKFNHYLKKSRGHESYFASPRGIAVDTAATEHIYVCDTNRHMLIVLDKKGHVLTRVGTRGGGKGPGEFRYPTQVVAFGDEIAVLDSGNSRVQILDSQGHFLSEVRLAYASNRTGLAMDNDKNLYLTDAELNRLQVFNGDGKLLYEFGEAGTTPGQFNGMSGIWVNSENCLYVVDTQNKRVQLFQIIRPNSDGC